MPPEGRSGVTLLELLVVIAVMAIVLTISMPAFTSMGRGAGMRGTVAEVKSTLSLARQWAITKREPVTFQYGYDTSATSDYYVVYVAAQQSSPYTIIQATNYLQKGFYFSDGGEMIFKPSGEVAKANDISISPITITITNLTDGEKTIVIQKLTGSIYVN